MGSVSALPIAHFFPEVRALTRNGVLPTQLISTLQHRLDQVKDVLQGSTIVTMGLLSSARGNRKDARELMQSVWWLDRRAISEDTLQYAQGWLITDAAAEGQWARVRALLPEAPDTAAMRFFGHLAGRVLGGPALILPSDDWYQLPVEARRFSETFSGQVTAAVLVGLTDPFQSVLWQLLRSKEMGADLSRVARQVDELLRSPRLRDRLMERATMLGGGSPDDALGELRTLFEETLGEVLEKVSGDEPLLRVVAARRREALIETLYERIDRLTDACSDGTAPPMPEVWREFVAIRLCYSRAVALSEPADRGWPHHVLLRLTRYFGTWLRRSKKELPFAHAVFRFLELEAGLAGDDTAARLAKASGELCLPFKLEN